MELYSGILYYPIGWIYLWIRYRNKEKIKSILAEKYEDSYHNAGAQLVLSTFGKLLFALLLLMLLTVIGRAIYEVFT
ncbi:hypothetical protein WNY78_04365 [Psychroserpens sp. AS72]|uniref:hypothetical protein n=1 Tax=Psychroserpens sp. AS72 TaxID=3135775 RepID=UPI003181BFF7